MKRIRLRTLMLLVVIAASSSALMVQRLRSARREAELQARRAELGQLQAVLNLQLARKVLADPSAAMNDANRWVGIGHPAVLLFSDGA